MSIASSTRVLLVAGAGLALAFAAPAFAQVDETQAASVPSCSASVTDHCIRRGGEHHGMGHHHHGHHGHPGHHHHHHKG